MKLYEELLNQTHLLIAGATGSGKSVVINGMIATALKNRPNDVQFILIDPKRVELIDYKGLPQTIKYASEPDAMVDALQYAMCLCDTRYEAMQHARIKKWFGSHVYVVIDELADLMTTDKKRVMPLIQRLCQVGRAAGISVLAATQCPLASVIPTPIKVNFDSKVALRTVTAQHSRNIMDATGCEKLPRYGKAYFVRPEGTDIVNVPMFNEAEIKAIIACCNSPEIAPPPMRRAEPRKVAPEPKPEPEKHRGFFGRLFA